MTTTLELRGRTVNIKDTGGRVPPGAVYCGRPNPARGLPDTGYGNPFPIRNYADPADRERVCDQHESLWRRRLSTEPGLAAKLLRDLDSKTLVCFCRADQRCHTQTYRLLCAEIRAGLIRTI